MAAKEHRGWCGDGGHASNLNWRVGVKITTHQIIELYTLKDEFYVNVSSFNNFYVFECLPMYIVCVPCVLWYPWRPEGIRSPGTWVTSSWESPCGSGPLQEQQAFLTLSHLSNPNFSMVFNKDCLTSFFPVCNTSYFFPYCRVRKPSWILSVGTTETTLVLFLMLIGK